MSSQIDVTKNKLFGKNGLGVTNLKLFLGSNSDATFEEIAEQIDKALIQINIGTAELVTKHNY